jgi:hypothetical protein
MAVGRGDEASGHVVAEERDCRGMASVAHRQGAAGASSVLRIGKRRLRTPPELITTLLAVPSSSLSSELLRTVVLIATPSTSCVLDCVKNPKSRPGPKTVPMAVPPLSTVCVLALNTVLLATPKTS